MSHKIENKRIQVQVVNDDFTTVQVNDNNVAIIVNPNEQDWIYGEHMRIRRKRIRGFSNVASGSAGGGSDPNVQEVLSLFPDLDTIYRNAVTDAVLSNTDQWSSIKCFQWYGMDSNANSLKDWKAFSDATLSNATQFETKYIQTNGIDQHINPGINPSTDFDDSDDWFISVYLFANDDSIPARLTSMLGIAGTSKFEIGQSGSATQYGFGSGSLDTYSTDSLLTDRTLYTVARLAGTVYLLKGDTVIDSFSSEEQTLPDLDIFVGALNNSGSRSQPFAGRFQCFISGIYSGVNFTVLTNSIEQLITDLSIESGTYFRVHVAFENADPAPLADPMIVYTGHSFIVTQPNENMSVGSNVMSKTGAGGAATNFIQSSNIIRRRGRMLVGKCRVTNIAANAGIRFNSTNPHTVQLNSGSASVADRFSNVTIGFSISVDTWYYLIIILRSSGAFYMISDGISNYLLYPSLRWNDSNLPVYLYLGSTAAGGVQSDSDWIREARLSGGIIADDWGFDTDSLSDANNGDPFIHNASGWIVFRVQTLPSSGNIEIKFRIQDSGNYMSLQIGPNGAGNSGIYEVVATTPNQLGSSFQVAAAAEYRLYLNGSTIILFNDATSPQLINTNGSNFITETDGEVTNQGTGGNVTYVHTMPFLISDIEFTSQILQVIQQSEPSGDFSIQTLYVSPSGSGDGSEGNPMSLASARANSGPGTTLIFQAGTYSADFSNISEFGTQLLPITWRPATGAVVRLESTVGDFFINGADFIIDGNNGYMEIYTEAWIGDRFLTSDAFDFGVFGVRSQVKNSVIRDFGNIGSWQSAVDSAIKGNLITNIGRGNGSQGHPLYIQNETGEKVFEDNVIVQTFESAFIIHQYGSGLSSLKNCTFRRNICAGGRWLAGSGGTKVENLTITNNAHVGPGTFEIGLLGAADPLHDGITITDNISVDGGINLKKGTNISILRNEFDKSTAAVYTINNVEGSIDVDDNIYRYYDSVPTNKWQYNTNNYSSLASWQSGTGFDADGSYEDYASSVPPDYVKVYPSQVANNRAGVFIKNYSESSSVDVDLSEVLGLVVGNSYLLISGQNYEEYHQFTLASNKIVAVPMTGWTMGIPYGTAGGDMPAQDSFFPRIGIFYLMPDYTTVP